ncbi:hypothetical protein [Streptomyces sp. NPDC046197]|uniref:hypothetical protein n=1 Tax=Streptomyces sp. NPDC046197 TaxID=3154337 RepID=UPI0033C48832
MRSTQAKDHLAGEPSPGPHRAVGLPAAPPVRRSDAEGAGEQRRAVVPDTGTRVLRAVDGDVAGGPGCPLPATGAADTVGAKFGRPAAQGLRHLASAALEPRAARRLRDPVCAPGTVPGTGRGAPPGDDGSGPGVRLSGGSRVTGR